MKQHILHFSDINRAIIERYREDMSEGRGEAYFSGHLKERVMLAQAFFHGGSRDEIEDICRKLTDHFAWGEFHTFIPLVFTVTLIQNRDRLPPYMADMMENYLKECTEVALHPTWDFCGVNDNTPAMIAVYLYLTGEYFGMPELCRVGLDRIRDFKQMMERRMFTSEFNSPCYLPITIYPFAAMYEYARDDEARSIAYATEQLLWRSALAMYFSPACALAGPFGRAYLSGKNAALSMMCHTFSRMLSDIRETLQKDDPLLGFVGEYEVKQYCPIGDISDMSYAAWLGNVRYHCAREILAELAGRKYPYSVSGKAEISPSHERYLLPLLGDSPFRSLRGPNIFRDDLSDAAKLDDCFEYPSKTVTVSAYMEPSFALGTSTGEFHNGKQTDSFTLIYTKSPSPAERQEEIGTVYTSYFVNEENGIHDDMGRKLAFQGEDTAMVLYHPKVTVKDPVNYAALKLIFSNCFEMGTRITVGGVEISAEEANAQVFPITDEIFVDSGNAYMYIKPLVNAKDAERAFIRIEKPTDEDIPCLHIALVNLEDSSDPLFKKELGMITNGFIFSVGEKNKYSSFDGFKAQFENATLSDEVICNVHTRYTHMREVKFSSSRHKLAICFSPITDGIKYAIADGKVIE